MLGHLGLQDLLHYPLYDLAQEVGIVQQDLLHQLRVRPTMICGHRHSVSIRLTSNTDHLGGRWPFFLADHRFTELYGHNLTEVLDRLFSELA